MYQELTEEICIITCITNFMKNIKITAKILALALALALIVPCLASCSNKAVFTFTADNGKTYTISDAEMNFFMVYQKTNALTSSGVQAKYATSFFAQTTDDGITYDVYFTQNVVEQMKTLLIEKYLFEKLELSYDAEKLASYEKQVKESVQSRGGVGAFKQYWGYTSTQLLDYYKVLLRSEAINDYLYGEDGKDVVTDADKLTYYIENYVGYQIIQLDMKNKIKVDDNGERVRKTSKDEDGNTVLNDEYEKVELTDEEADEKALLPKLITDKLAEGEDFETLATQYSDSYISAKYPKGIFVHNTTHIVENETIIDALKELEIGDYTEALTISDGAYTYIIKRIELAEKAYEDEDYSELFTSYTDLVQDGKYEKYLEPYITLIVVPSDITTKYTMTNTFTSEYVDYYYTYMQYYSNYNS